MTATRKKLPEKPSAAHLTQALNLSLKPSAAGALLAVLLSMTPDISSAADPLSAYRWQNRLILCYSPPGADSRRLESELTKVLQRESRGIADRDLLLIDVSADPLGVKNVKILSPRQAASLRHRMGFGGDDAIFVLVGKDGSEKSRHAGALRLDKFFALIDTMPMRRVEMQERTN